MDALSLLKQDHREVEALFDDFEDEDADKAGIAAQICQMLTVHAQIEEEIFYPACREALDDDEGEDLLDEAEVEHAGAKHLIAQIEAEGEQDELFEAKVKVLGEYIRHHVKEEEKELFPQVKKADLDLDAIGDQLETRKQELMAQDMSTSGKSSGKAKAKSGAAARKK